MNVKELERRYLLLTKEVEQLKESNLILMKDNEKGLIRENCQLKQTNKELLQENIELKEQLKKYNSGKRKYIKKNKEEKERTKKYEEFRKAILKRDNYRCRECGSKYRLQVHHIKARKDYPELIMDEKNCITLCISCHSKTNNFFVT